MKVFRFPLLLGLLICCFANFSFAQLFNYDYYVNEKISSTQTSLTACPNGDAASVHNMAERGIISDQRSTDILVNVVDVSGNVKFTKKYGATNRIERGNSIVKSGEDGFIIVGTQRHPTLGANGVLAYEINGSGVVQWAKWYGIPEARIGGEGFVIRRFDADQLMIAGTSTNSRDIIALLIKSNGGLIWSKRYTTFSISSESIYTKVVTELIEDQRVDGYVIAGTNYFGSSANPNTKSQMFTFGVGLDGSITRKYTLYDTKNFSSFNPAMAPAFAEGNFIVTGGLRNGITDGLPNSYIFAMELNSRLEPIWTKVYASPGTVNQHGHSIYRSLATNSYKIGALYQGLGAEFFIPRNTAFVSLLSNGNPNYLLRYKRNMNQQSTYMTYDETNDNYLIKSDNSFSNSTSLGLIRTSQSGRASCARSEALDAKEIKTEFKQLGSAVNVFGGSYSTRVGTFNFEVRPDQCFFESAGSEEELELELQAKANDGTSFKAYPTLLDAGETELKVDVTLAADTEISIRVYDNLGRLVLQKVELGFAGNNQLIVGTDDLPSGVNVITLVAADQTHLGTSKIVVQ